MFFVIKGKSSTFPKFKNLEYFAPFFIESTCVHYFDGKIVVKEEEKDIKIFPFSSSSTESEVALLKENAKYLLHLLKSSKISVPVKEEERDFPSELRKILEFLLEIINTEYPEMDTFEIIVEE